MNWLESHTIIGFWFGKGMSPNRKFHYDRLREQCGCNFLLITDENIYKYIHPNVTLHPAFEYLSETHKSDYLRTYMMHLYGGGYCDIKMTTGDWNSHFDTLLTSPDKWICGYPEEHPDHIACDSVRDKWRSLIGVISFICKPNTPLTDKWYNEMINLLDSKLPYLKENPATYPQDRSETGSNYPLAWNEMLGRIFHCICAEYIDHILPTLPRPTAIGDYR
jgi:hypothetical protein